MKRSYLGRMRRRNISLCVLAVIGVAGCSTSAGVSAGDAEAHGGILVAAKRVSVAVAPVATSLEADRAADYSGFAGALDAGDFVLAHGFDDTVEEGLPERSALWRSTDMKSWERVGEDIGEPAGQQAVRGLARSGDDMVVAVGDDFGPDYDAWNDPAVLAMGGVYPVALAWRSPDGRTWQRSRIAKRAVAYGVITRAIDSSPGEGPSARSDHFVRRSGSPTMAG